MWGLIRNWMILEILEFIKVWPRYSAKTEDQVNANRLYSTHHIQYNVNYTSCTHPHTHPHTRTPTHIHTHTYTHTHTHTVLSLCSWLGWYRSVSTVLCLWPWVWGGWSGRGVSQLYGTIAAEDKHYSWLSWGCTEGARVLAWGGK